VVVELEPPHAPSARQVTSAATVIGARRPRELSTSVTGEIVDGGDGPCAGALSA